MFEIIKKFIAELAEFLPEIKIPLVLRGEIKSREPTKTTIPKQGEAISLAEAIGIKSQVIHSLNAEVKLVTGLAPYAGVITEARNIQRGILKQGIIDLDHDRHSLLFMTRPKIGAEEVQDLGYDGAGVKIAIIDTGVDINHPDLPNVVARYNVIEDETPDDYNGHGTHVGGIAAGKGIQEPDYRGIAPEAEIISVKVLSADGYGTSMGVAKGVELAVDSGAHVLNLSLGGSGGEGSPEFDAVEEAWRLGHVVAVAAGNEGDYGWATIGSPGCAPSVITVAALNKTSDAIAGYSSRGPVPEHVVKPDITAPGGDYIFGCNKRTQVVSAKSTYSNWDCVFDRMYVGAIGTSMATPHIAGSAAIIIQVLKDNGFSYGGKEFSDTVKAILLKTARRISGVSVWEQGAGIVDLVSALKLAEKTKSPLKYEIPYETPPVSHPSGCGWLYGRKIPKEAIPILRELSKKYYFVSLGRIGRIALSLLNKRPSEAAYEILSMEINTFTLYRELLIIEKVEKYSEDKQFRAKIRKLRSLLKVRK